MSQYQARAKEMDNLMPDIEEQMKLISLTPGKKTVKLSLQVFIEPVGLYIQKGFVILYIYTLEVEVWVLQSQSPYPHTHTLNNFVPGIVILVKEYIYIATLSVLGGGVEGREVNPFKHKYIYPLFWVDICELF